MCEYLGVPKSSSESFPSKPSTVIENLGKSAPALIAVGFTLTVKGAFVILKLTLMFSGVL